MDAECGIVHDAHAHVKPTGEGPGIQAVYWCEGVTP
jgi:hypothetical protein